MSQDSNQRECPTSPSGAHVRGLAETACLYCRVDVPLTTATCATPRERMSDGQRGNHSAIVERYLRASVTLEDAQRAADAWGANCGPGALAAALNKTLDDVRPHLVGFDLKGYTNPTMMFAALRELGVRWKDVPGWPTNGLVRVQWGGPWMQVGVPIRARYRHTHWIATRLVDDDLYAFDINGACVGWMPFEEWSGQLAPWLIREAVKRGDGTWLPTHRLEIDA